jgi:hypothetical protein
MAIPSLLKLERNFRSDGDSRVLSGEIGLAKMRAASDFTKARVYADTSAKTIRVQIWCKTATSPCTSANTWLDEGGTITLSTGVSYGYGTLSTPPTNTQTSIGQAGACQSDAQTVSGSAGTTANSACMIFNSRGIPIDAGGSPTGQYALYLNDGNSVYGATVAATGLLRLWRTDIGTASWTQR